MKYSILLLVLTLFACSSPKVRKPVHRSSSTFMEESIERNQNIIANEVKVFKEIISNDTAHKYITSPNGFWYYYSKKIDLETPMPKVGDEVLFNFEILDLNNNIIYTKEELGSKNQPIEGNRLLRIDAEDFLTGMHQGLKLMKVGEKVTFLFPSNKAFGISGFQDRIRSNQPLIIDVNLVEILKNETSTTIIPKIDLSKKTTNNK